MSRRHAGHRRSERGPSRRVFAVECPGCRSHLAVHARMAGDGARCPTCRTAFLVPDVPSPPPPQVAPAPVETPVEPAPPPAVTASSEPVVFSEPPLPSTRLRVAPPAAEPPVPYDANGAERDEALAPAPADTSSEPAPVDPAIAFREPVKTILHGDQVLELRRLTPEERRLRRARRNLLILVIGAALLVALVTALT